MLKYHSFWEDKLDEYKKRTCASFMSKTRSKHCAHSCQNLEGSEAQICLCKMQKTRSVLIWSTVKYCWEIKKSIYFCTDTIIESAFSQAFFIKTVEQDSWMDLVKGQMTSAQYRVYNRLSAGINVFFDLPSGLGVLHPTPQPEQDFSVCFLVSNIVDHNSRSTFCTHFFTRE